MRRNVLGSRGADASSAAPRKSMVSMSPQGGIYCTESVVQRLLDQETIRASYEKMRSMAVSVIADVTDGGRVHPSPAVKRLVLEIISGDLEMGLRSMSMCASGLASSVAFLFADLGLDSANDHRLAALQDMEADIEIARQRMFVSYPFDDVVAAIDHLKSPDTNSPQEWSREAKRVSRALRRALNWDTAVSNSTSHQQGDVSNGQL